MRRSEAAGRGVLTCGCFFGWGATGFEMPFTSLWTWAKIWLRSSTFSFLTALICGDKGFRPCCRGDGEDQSTEGRGAGLTCFSVVVTGLALFFSFRCLLETWKTVLVFFPLCLFFPISPATQQTASIIRVSLSGGAGGLRRHQGKRKCLKTLFKVNLTDDVKHKHLCSHQHPGSVRPRLLHNLYQLWGWCLFESKRSLFKLLL